jgi:hypothetical protein
MGLMISRRVNYILVAAAMATAFVCGCAGNGAPNGVWIANEMTAITDRAAAPKNDTAYDEATRTIRLAAAGGDTAAFQIVVDSPSPDARDVRISCGKLIGPGGDSLGASDVKIFRMLPVNISSTPAGLLRLSQEEPAKIIYDALLPLKDGLSHARQGETRLAFWVDVSAPPDAAAGEYVGTIRVAAPDGEISFRILLRVYDFTLPESPSIPAIGGFGYPEIFRATLRRNGRPYVPVYLDRRRDEVRRGLSVQRELMLLARQHRLDLFDKSIHPLLKRDAYGSVRLEWDDYDAIVMPYLTGTAFPDRIGVAAWPLPVSDAWPNAADYAATGPNSYAATAAAALSQSALHLRDAGLSDRTFAWIVRGDIGPDAYAAQLQMAEIARVAAPTTPILCTLPPQMPAESLLAAPPRLDELADVFAPPGEYFFPRSADATPATSASGFRGQWLCPGTPPMTPSLDLSCSPAEARALPLAAMKYDASGVLIPEVLNWQDDPAAAPQPPQACLFYPGAMAGTDGVLASARLKRLRSGLADMEYLQLLRRHGQPMIADEILSALVRYAGLAAAGDNYLDGRLEGIEQDAAVWQLARTLMAEELQRVIRGDGVGEADLQTNRLAWKDLETRTRFVLVEQVRSHIGEGVEAGKLQATFTAELFNQLSTDANVELRLEDTPDVFTPVAPRATIPRMGSFSRATATLDADFAYAPAGAGGKYRLGLLLSAGEKPHRLLAVAPVILAGQVGRKPAIDGDLRDWPMRAGNTAGDFRLLGRRGDRGNGLAVRTTDASVLADADTLYIALRCREPNPAGMVVRRNNFVECRNLLTAGEDLVEILLDPGAGGKSAENLYRIVVKPNGTILADRGVRCEPPLGRVRAWPARIEAAVGATSDGWTVELAIPLASFGEKNAARVWGLNFSRYATQGEESSNWAEARRNIYDPRSLGTLLIGTVPEARREK